MRAASRMLALDLGAESGRAILGELDGERLTLEEVRRFPNGGIEVGGRLHWDVLRLWSEVAGSVVSAAGSGELHSIGVDSWGVDYGLLDARGRLLGNPVHYRDRRTEGMLERALALVPKLELYERTGIQFMPINTIYQLLAQVLDEDPQLELAAHLLFVPDLMHYWLTGVMASEGTIASTSQCYDPRAAGWARDVLRRLGIPQAMFEPVIPAGTDLGPLGAALRDQVRCRDCRVVAPGSHDTASAVVAVPFEPGVPSAYISSGTWSLVGVEVREPVMSAAALGHNLSNEGGVGGRIRLLRNVMGLWLLQECRRALAAGGREPSYSQLLSKAEAAHEPAGLIDPDQEAFLRPGDMPALIRQFCRGHGEPEPADPGALVRTILQSLALKYRFVVERLEEVTGTPISAVHVVGGGARISLLCQMTADACARPVLAGPVEATAAGNLLVQAMAQGELASLEEARDVVRRSFSIDRYEPAADRAYWDDAWGRFQRLLAGVGSSAGA